MMTSIEPRRTLDGACEVSTAYLLRQLASERMRANTELITVLNESDAQVLEEKITRYARCEEALVKSDSEYPSAPLRVPARAAENMDAFVRWAERKLYGSLVYQ